MNILVQSNHYLIACHKVSHDYIPAFWNLKAIQLKKCIIIFSCVCYSCVCVFFLNVFCGFVCFVCCFFCKFFAGTGFHVDKTITPNFEGIQKMIKLQINDILKAIIKSFTN